MKARLLLLAISFAIVLATGCVSSPPTEVLPPDSKSQAASLADEIVRQITHDQYFMRHLNNWTIQNHGEKPRIVVVRGTHRSPFRETTIPEEIGEQLSLALVRANLFSDCLIRTEAFSPETSEQKPDSDFIMNLMAFAMQTNEKITDTYTTFVLDAKTRRDVWSGCVQVITEKGVARMVKRGDWGTGK